MDLFSITIVGENGQEPHGVHWLAAVERCMIVHPVVHSLSFCRHHPSVIAFNRIPGISQAIELGVQQGAKPNIGESRYGSNVRVWGGLTEAQCSSNRQRPPLKFSSSGSVLDPTIDYFDLVFSFAFNNGSFRNCPLRYLPSL